MKNRVRSNPFDYQRLEPRQLLAGNILVSLSGGVLELEGDSSANQFQIIGNPDGSARVVAPTGTTINGGTAPFSAAAGLRDVIVRSNGGDDSLTISGLVLTGDLNFSLGDGNDSFSIRDINVRSLGVDGGNGNDLMQFHNTFAHRDITIVGGAGDDVVSITAMAAGLNIIIDTGSGNDLLAIDNLGVRKSIVLNTGDGNDGVFMTGEVYGYKTNVRLGNGNDTLSVIPQTSNTTATFWRELNVDAGEGNDNIFLDSGVTSRRRTNLDGQGGTDAIGFAGAILKRPGLSGLENQLTNVNAALDAFYETLDDRGVNTTPFGRQPSARTPVLVVNDSVLNVPANSAAIAIDNQLTLTGDSRTIVTGATIQIANAVSGEDILAFTNTDKITGAFNATTGVLTLTGNATTGEYQTAMRTITYDNVRTLSLAGTRTINFTVNSADGNATDSRTLALAGAEAPTVSLANSTLTIPVNSAAVAIDNQLTLTGSAGTTVTGALIRLPVFVPIEDVLGFTSTASITGTFDSTTGELTLTGSATLAEYQTALRTVTYDNTTAKPATRIVEITVNSDAGSGTDSRNLTIEGLPAPVLSATSTPLEIPADSVPLVVDSLLTLTGDSTTVVTGAVVRVVNPFVGQDVLAFVNSGSISGTYNATTGILTLFGEASLNEYQSALRSVTFDNTRNPSVEGTRQIEFDVVTNAGSAQASRTLNLSGLDLPVLALASAPLKHFGTTSAQPLDSELTLSGDNGINASGAVVRITGTPSTADRLAFANTAGITGVFDQSTRTMTLTGNATLAEYQAALRNLTFDNTSTTTLEQSRRVDIAIFTDLGRVAASREIDLGDQLEIAAFAAASNLTTLKTASGAHYVITNPGNGNKPTLSSTVRVNYVGRFLDGNQFDAGNGVAFPLTGVIRGWQEGIPQFSVGGSGRLIVPSSLAYGPAGRPTASPPIPGNAILDFSVTLLEIV